MPFVPDSDSGAIGRFVPDQEEDQQPRDRTVGEIVTDTAASALGGINSLAKLPAMAIDKAVSGEWFGPGVEALNEFGEAIDLQKSEPLRQREEAKNRAVEEAGQAAQDWAGGDGKMATAARIAAELGVSIKEVVSDPALLASSVAQQLPNLGVMRAVGLGADKVAGTAASMAPRLAATRAGQAVVGKAGTSAAVGAGAAMQGADVGSDAYQRLLELPDSEWANHPDFARLADQLGPDEAKRQLASQEAMGAAQKAGAATLLTSMLPGGASMEKALVGRGSIPSMMSAPLDAARAVGRAVVGEARQEGLEEGFGQLYNNQAVGRVKWDQDLAQGVGGAAGEGGVVGGLMGGGATGVRAGRDLLAAGAERLRREPDSTAEPQAAAPAAAPAQPQAAQEYPDPVSRGTQPQAAEPTEAERALREPTSLTALDRAGEITVEQSRIAERLAELNDPAAGYGQAFDQERQALATRAGEFAAERDNITRTWPKAQPGQATSFTTEAGVRLDGQYALIDVDDLVTSHDANLRPNPLYPVELQPRARDRAASEMQISGIVQKLDPARLGLSADAGTGAPIVGADGLVESGNARTIALKRVYQANGQKAADYRQFLRDNADQFGLAPEQIEGMERPVLVRVRSTPVNRAEFARQANASTVAAMSPSEQAKSDAARIDSMEDLRPDEQGDFQGSREFIRRFMARLPVTEQAGMIDSTGALSAAGYARVRNAVLAKAYGDSPVLMRMVESMDDNLRNVSKALMSAAPKVAQMRQSVAAGQRFDADITPDLMAAVEELSRLKDDGVSVQDALAQAGMFGEKYSQETRDLLQFLADNIRRPRRMAEFITAYMDALDAAGDPNQGSLLGDVEPPAKADIMAAARRQIEGEPDAQASDPAREAGQDHGNGAEGRGQQENAPRGEGRPAGDGPAAEPGAESEWVAFGPETGTLGIPRAEMPQVKNKDRGALINFLEARGIAHENDRVPASSLKPTQAEYSRNKVDKFVETGAIGERSVLISSDGHVLDGHHQWLGHAERGEAINVIRLDAPIRELLQVVNDFPGVKRSEGAADIKQLRAAAVRDFKDALADLAEIASKHTRAAMLPEDTPGLKEALVKLFDAALRIVGTDMRAATRWVRDQLRQDPATKKIANFIRTSTMEEAARQALAQVEKSGGAQAGLFDSLEQATDALQGDLFGAQAAPVLAEPVKVAKIKGRAYDMKRDNFKAPDAAEFVSPALLEKANALIAEFFKGDAKPAVKIGEADRAKAEEALRPLLKRAEDAKPAFDQAVIDVAAEYGIGQLIAPLKSIGRAAEKVVNDYQGDAAQIADLLRATVIVSSYGDAAAVISALSQSLTIEKIKNKAGADLSGIAADLAAKVRNQDRAVFGGYADVSMVARTANGVLSEIQINIPSMMAIKDAQGHALYEAARVQEDGSKAKRDLDAAMAEIYDEAFAFSEAARRASATQPRKAASEPAWQDDTGGPGNLTSATRSSSNRNQPSSGMRTNSSPPKDDANSEPAGNLSGTGIDITSPRKQSVPQLPANGYTGGDLFGADDATVQPGGGRTQAQGAGPAQEAGRGGEAARVRKGSGRGDRRPGGGADAGAAAEGELGQARADGVRGADARGGSVESGARAGRPAGVPAGQRSGRRDAGVPDAAAEGAGATGNESAQSPAARPAGRDIPPKSGRNYRFGADDLTYEGSWFKKAEQNVEAVELLRALEKEGRQATPEEQAKLARFIGWGASELANGIFGTKIERNEAKLGAYVKARALFDGGAKEIGPRDDGYYSIRAYLPYVRYGAPITPADATLAKFDLDSQEVKYFQLRQRLKAAMTDAEWAEAKRSTQYAHYTSKSVVQSMWKAMERMGFQGGTILEPGAGIGVFPGLMPEGMAANSIYTGIEFDSITGGVLKQLFPDERILVESFVDSKLPKNFYDVAVGNPPFSGTKILGDPEYQKRALSLHDYFFAKSIDRVKPGGLVVYVTSRYTMDKLDDKARAYLSERADLVGAIRLPQTAFKQNAGTEVVTDVIFLRKKKPGEKFEQAQPWAKSVPLKVGDETFNVNEYFVANPDMVLGKPSSAGSMYSKNEYTVEPLEGDIEQHFAKAIERLPEGIYQPERGSAAEAVKVREIDFNPKAKKEGNYYVSDKGALMIREGGVGQVVELKSQKDAEIIKDFVPLRDALKQAHYDQLNDGAWEDSIKALQAAYAKFTKKHGQINQFVTRTVKTKVVDEDTGETFTDETPVRSYPLLEKLRDDPDYTLVAALETINDDTGEIKPSNFLTERVLGKPGEAQVKTPSDALLSSLNDVGHVDIGLIAQRLGLAEPDAIEALGSAIYQDPEAGWQTADDYLSGNVKRKLDAAREAAKADRRFERNVQALEAAQPAPKTPSQINVGLGMNWVPAEIYGQFLRELTGVRATVEWNARTKQWIVQETAGGRTMAAIADWGTSERNATELLEHGLSGRPIRITKTVGSGKDRTTVFDAAATEAANQKLDKLREEFSSWIWRDAERTDRLVRIYNDTFNTTVPRSFDGSHLTLPGTSKAFQVFDHVKRGAWRIIQRGNTYLAHAVGSGKTFQMVIAAMEQKRLSLIQKPMVVVPNHMLKQFAHEWQQLYPAARLMVADENNFHTENRRRFVSRVALSDLDGVVITHSAFKLLDLDPEFKAKIIEEQLDVMRAALEEAESDEGKGGRKSPRIKQIEKQIENLEQKLEASLSSVGKDRNVRFDELGVDFLMVDEAHEYRKLDFGTSRQVKGISPQGSARALDLYIKARYLEEKNPGRSLVMASGTPVTNTLAELYTVQKFMDRQAMIDKGIDDFDSWAAMFGRERTVLEPNAAGKYEPVTRFSKFVNVPELTQMFREFADVLTADHLAALLGDKRPKVEGGGRKVIVTPKGRDYTLYQRELERRVAESKAWKPSKDEPNNPDPIIKIIGDGRLAAIDMRFIWPDSPSDPDSKLNRMIDDVIATYKATSDMEFTDKAGKVEPNRGAAMMVFSDLGFGAGVAASRGFNARAWFEKRLRDAGVPAAQVAFMSDYKKSADKLKLFKDVNAGRVRILIGSSKNMGTGVNAQQRLKALFHLDSPWYPADLEQREGRIIRQGNKNRLVQIFAYAAKGTYDENMWKMLASKQFFIDQALSGDETVRELEDLDSQSQYDLAAAMVAEDPRVMQLAGARAEIEKLNRLYQAHEDQRFRFRRQFEQAQLTVEFNEKRLPEAERQAKLVQDLAGDNFKAKALGKTYADRKEWAGALMAKFKDLSAAADPKPLTIGEISGFPIVYTPETLGTEFRPKAMLQTADPLILFNDPSDPLTGIAMRAQNAVAEIARLPAKMRERITEARAQMDALQTRLEAAFPMAGMLADKVKEAAEIEEAIKEDSKPKTWRVERNDNGQGFDVQATNADEAIDAAIAAQGGTRADWKAIAPGSSVAGNGASFGPLYHGTPEGFESFDPARLGKGGSGYNHQGAAVYLTSDKGGYARFFARNAVAKRENLSLDDDGVILTVSLDPAARILDMRRGDVDAEVQRLFKDSAINRAQAEALKQRVLDLGYDGLAFQEPNAPEGWAVDPAAMTVALYKPDLARVEPAQGERVTQLSRGTGAGGIAMRDLQAVVSRVSKGLKNLPKVHVFASPSDLSAKVADQKALRDYIKRAGAMEDAEGATHNGEIYLFASGLADEARAEHVLVTHELTHYGLRGAFGKDLDAALQHVWVNNAAIRKQAAEARQRLGLPSNLDAVEEVLAEIPASELAGVKGWRRVVKAARDWLARIGASAMAARLDRWLQSGLNDQARADLFVADLLTTAREWVRTGRGGRGGVMSDFTRLSSSLAEDVERQEKWLTAEAKARGYADIEDLLAKNYPLFEKLAAKWREKNPADGGVMLSRPAGEAALMAAADAIAAMPADKRDNTELGDFPGAASGYNLYEARKLLPKPSPKLKRVTENNTFGLWQNYDYIANVDGELFGVTKQEDPDATEDDDTAFVYEFERLVDPFKSSVTTITDQTDVLFEEMRKAKAKTMLSRAPQRATAAERADKIIATKAGSRAPLDYLARAATRISGVDRLTGALYNRAAYLLDRYTPEQIKAGVVADYGVPEAVIDQRAMMQGRQRVQLRKAGALIEKLATLTRAESRVAYEWMNMDGSDPKAYLSAMEGLPEESVKVLQEVQQLIDKLSREAMALGQLSPEAYERNRFAYLRRSYAKHVIEQTAGEKAKRARVISILGDQYKGRGLTEAAPMAKIQNTAPEWWRRKLQAGKADAGLKGEKFVRLERRAPAGAGTQALPGMAGRQDGRLLEVAYYPAGQALPAKFKDWEQAVTFEVRDVKGGNLILWRDFTKEERERMGEVDEARFAIAKTMHGMIHDVEVGRYLEWIGHTYAKKEGETIPGTVVEASERYRDTFAPGEWVRVPDSKIPGTQVAKYGKLAGRYIPGPIWNDLRQVVGGAFKPFGDTYANILRLWKTSKTALSPAVHMNNIMSNFVMADWHDVGAVHVGKALRIILGASQRNGAGALGRAANVLARGGIADAEAAREVLNRYKDSGGDIGSWVTNEIARDQLEPLLADLEKELAATAGASHQAQVGVMAALQHALMLRFPSAWEAFKGGKVGKAAVTEGQALIDLYQAEDDIFRLAAWLKAKEDGKGDLEAGKASRKSFLDYHINAPWVQMMRSTAWPFISFTYRAVPMMLETAAKKPHKLLKLMAIAGGLNALGSMLAGGGDDERKLLPEEKAGKIWGIVPKLIRMPWNDQNGHPVYLDIRRFIPVGDVFDVGQGHSAVPILPGLQPGGPMALAAEVVVNRSMFTGKPITLDTDTQAQKAAKLGDYLYKAFAPNILGLPNTYATTAVSDAARGKTDAFGREQSVAQAVASSFGVKLGSYPADVLRLNLSRKTQAELMEIDRNITLLKRRRMLKQIDKQEFDEQVRVEQDKQRKILKEAREKMGR